jgi:hypothetical protein
LGEDLKQRGKHGDQLALWDVGIIPYSSGLETVDLGGLNSRRLVKEFQRGYSFNRFPATVAEVFAESILVWRPRFIVLKEFQGIIADEGPAKALERQPNFHTEYQRIDPPNPSHYAAWEARNPLNGFQEKMKKVTN